MANVRLHLFVQSYTLILVPLVISLLVESLQLVDLVNPLFLRGYVCSNCLVTNDDDNDSPYHRLLVVGCMPPPVSTAVILTKAVGGNEVSYFIIILLS